MEENIIENIKPVTEIEDDRHLEILWHKADDDVLNIEAANNVKFYGNDEQRTALLAAYTEYIGEVGNPVQNKLNPFTKSYYATLDEVLNTVRPLLSKHGLAVIQVPMNDSGFVYTQNLLVHKNGGQMVFPPFGVPVKGNTAQDTIAALTYSRRGSLNVVAGTHGEADDDGNQASGNDGEKKPKVSAELKEARGKATELAKEVSAKIGKEKVAEAIKNAAGVVNPNTITEIKDVKKVIGILEKLAKEDK